MDLRNYFSTKPKPKAGAVNAPEEKPKPEPEKQKAASRRKKTIHETDDEEEVVVKSKHFTEPSATKAATNAGTKAASTPAKKKEDEVDPKSFFASSKTKASEATQATTGSGATKSATSTHAKTTSEQVKNSPAKTTTEQPKATPAKTTSEQTTTIPAKAASTTSTSLKRNKADEDDYFEDDSDAEVLPKPKTRGAPVPKQTAIKSEPKAKPTQNKRKKTEDDYSDDDGDAYQDDKEEDVKPVKRQKTAPKKKVAVDDSAMDVDEPKEETSKPKFNYWAHKNKAGPSALGSKDIPVGKDNCLAGWAFVFTGELSSITRDDAVDLVKRYSGRVTGSPSGKTSFVVVGEDAGQSKLDKVKKLKIKTLNEDEFLDLIRTSPAKTEDGQVIPEGKKDSAKRTSASSTAVKTEDRAASAPASSSKAAAAPQKAHSAPTAKSSHKESAPSPTSDSDKPIEVDLWTTKHRPQQIKDLCGNGAQVQRLQRWLEGWDKNYKANFKVDNSDKSGTFRAVLISGPPGIGKTSAAHLVGESLGFNIVEFNASDTRSKKSLDNEVRDLLDNQSLAGYFTGGAKIDGKGKSPASNGDPSMKKKQLIIMDEVDGMAGGDRGGVAQLITFIKKTHVPIICICNDRQSPKVRSLANSCFDMRFQRPQAAQVRARLMSILFREGRQIPANVLDKLVGGSQSDIRQVLNMLSTWSLTKQTMNYDEGIALSKSSEKYVALNPFQIAENLLIESSYRGLSVAEKFDAYFNDYQLAPLMIQENYIRMNPTAARGDDGGLEAIELMSKAADSFSDADLVDSMIHGSAQHWSLMQTHAAFTCVRPSYFVHGSMRPGSGSGYGPLMQFPSFLGQLSKSSKYNRLLKEIQIRMRLKISGDKNEVRQNYLPALFPALTRPLVKDGVEAIPELIELMDSYFLSKEDWDAILELGIGRSDGKAVLDKIPSATKSAFTRRYNEVSHPQPFLKPTVVTKGRGGGGAVGSEETPDNLDVVEADEPVPEETEEVDDAETEDIEKDRNIKQKKARGAKGSASSKAKGKGKAPARSRK